MTIIWKFSTHPKINDNNGYSVIWVSDHELERNITGLLQSDPNANAEVLARLFLNNFNKEIYASQRPTGSRSLPAPTDKQFQDMADLYNRLLQPPAVAIATATRATIEASLKECIRALRNYETRHLVSIDASSSGNEDSAPLSEMIPDPASRKAAVKLTSTLSQAQAEDLLKQRSQKIGVGNNDVSKALTELLHTARHEETRWQAAISLGKVDPGNPEAGRQRAKLIDFGMQLGGHPVALIVGLMPRADGKIGVFLQVQPTSVQTHLPPGLKLGLLSKSDETIREIEARSDAQGQGKDDCIQLAFSCPPGTDLRVKVTCNNVSFTESFVI